MPRRARGVKLAAVETAVSSHEMGNTQRTRYDAVAMTIHWLTAALMIFMIALGENMMESGEDAARAGDLAGATFPPTLHVSVGVSILLLTLLRIVWRMSHAAPPYPATMKSYEITASRALHGLFYLLMIGIPLTGWLAFGNFLSEAPALAGIKLFGLIPIPAAPLTGETFGDIHEIGSRLAMLLIILHTLAALKHQFLDRDGILKRMLPH
jgi:cytochrome b561